jgi:isocitrate dehydrogenase
MAHTPVPITVAHGDGIGPEIMAATLRILQAGGAALAIEEVEVGEKVYQRGIMTGMDNHTFDSIRRTKVFLKAPITTPQGGGYKSLNVTTRKAFGLYANVRPCVTYAPYIDTKYPGMDVVIIRENEEDLYAGIEHRLTAEVFQSLKLISRPGSEKIIRFAFEYAVKYGRKKVTCFTKDNIMKLTDGLFHKVFDEIGNEYPHIEKEHWIVDIGSAKLADTPTVFDVIVTENLYGDIISDIAAQIAGSIGIAGSANIGTECAMFEAIHGSAPRRAGQNLANPSGLFLSAVQMLVHIGQPDVAETVHNAWLKTMEDGIHTYDIFQEGISKQKVGTKEFADAVIARLGQKPTSLPAVTYNGASVSEKKEFIYQRASVKKELVGFDIFVDWEDTVEALAEKLETITEAEGLKIAVISNRGIKVWPNGNPETFCTDHYQVRVIGKDNNTVVSRLAGARLLQKLASENIHYVGMMNLTKFDGIDGFSKSSGE